MNEVVVIVEGQTELAFVRDCLAVHLRARGVEVWGRPAGKSKSKWGVPKWQSAKNDILRTLKENRYVTTMFDFYGIPEDWPGRADAAGQVWDERGDYVEQRISQSIAEAAGNGFDSRQFIPYVQVHEFEALLFADVKKASQSLSPLCRRPEEQLHADLREFLEAAGNPEAINDGFETSPARRIKAAAPGYDKVAFGPGIAGKIGLETIRAACPHFGQWLTKLESLR